MSQTIATLINTFGKSIAIKEEKKQELLREALEERDILMIDALLSIGAIPHSERAQMAQKAFSTMSCCSFAYPSQSVRET